MAAYVIAQMAVHDVEMYREYAMAVMRTAEAFGARIIAANDAAETFEGAPAYPRTVIGEFPNAEAARAWYGSAEYQAIKHLRINATSSTVILVEGLTLPEAPHDVAGAKS